MNERTMFSDKDILKCNEGFDEKVNPLLFFVDVVVAVVVVTVVFIDVVVVFSVCLFF